MRLFFGIFLIFMTVTLQGQNTSLEHIRTMYFDGWNDECGASELVALLKDKDVDHDPLMMAYKGAAMTTLANCKKTPFGKLSVFNDGKKLIENAVEEAPGNIEIRLLRYTVQTNIPGFLNYDNREADKKLMLESLTLQENSSGDRDLRNRIIHYLVDYGDLSDSEQKKIEQLTAGG